jgi:hypothetical protein
MASSVRVALALLAAVAAGCQSETAPAPAAPPLVTDTRITTNATVRFVALEGGCWLLETVDGSYQPVNLPAQYRVDGLRVCVVFKSAPSMVSVCMLAPLVSIETIRTA